MKLRFQSLDFTASQELTDFVQSKIEKLEHLYDEIIWSEVCLKLDKSDTKENKVCEIRLAIPGMIYWLMPNAKHLKKLSHNVWKH